MQNFLKVFIAIVLITITGNLRAQTIEEAGTAFNKAIELMKTDVNGAITAFENTLKMLDKIIANPESDQDAMTAEDLKMKAEQQLPNLYFRSATELYKEKKYDDAIKRYEETVAVCDKYKDESYKEKANGNIATLYSMKAYSAYKNKEFDSAIELIDKALASNPDDVRAMFYKGLFLNKLGKDDEMIAVLEKAIATGPDDDRSVENSRKLLAGHFSVEGAKLIEKKEFTEALALEGKALSYDSTFANAYYYYAAIYNFQENWDKAIEAANKGLELEKGGDMDKAKFYFELGNAYKGKGNNAEACNAYNSAAHGDFTEKAKQMKTELKCQ